MRLIVTESAVNVVTVMSFGYIRFDMSHVSFVELNINQFLNIVENRK